MAQPPMMPLVRVMLAALNVTPLSLVSLRTDEAVRPGLPRVLVPPLLSVVQPLKLTVGRAPPPPRTKSPMVIWFVAPMLMYGLEFSWLAPSWAVMLSRLTTLSAEPPPMTVNVPPASVTALAEARRTGLATALRPKLFQVRVPWARRRPAVLAMAPPSRSSSVPPRTTVVPA